MFSDDELNINNEPSDTQSSAQNEQQAKESGEKEQVYQKPKATMGATPTNLPPASSGTSGPLSKDEMSYLQKLADQNYVIKKTTKRFKQATLAENARTLSKIRRLYSAKVGHRYYGYPIVSVNKLRGRVEGGKGAAFGAAARKTKKLVLTIVIIVALLATLGTAAVVGVMVIGGGQGAQFVSDGLTISNSQNIPPSINSYILGEKVNLPIKIKNNTQKDVLVAFHIEMEIIEGSDLERAVANSLVDPNKLKFTYYYDDSNWGLVGGKLHYIANGGLMADSADDLEVISGFSIDIDSTEESNKWINYQMRLKLIVEFDQSNQ